MLRFGKKNGSRFNLDYTGTIYCFDSGNKCIATSSENPECWDGWNLKVDYGDKFETVFRRAIASAWSATALAERMAVEI